MGRVVGATIGTLTRVRTSEPVAALTFDDGPHPVYTPELLDLLDEHSARATFFMVGRNAATYPEVVERAVAEGHDVANHTWSHAVLPPLSHAERREEIRKCAAVLGEDESRLFRPPRTLQSFPSFVSARLAGYEVVAWSVQVEDWLDRPAGEMAAKLERWIFPGSIVLLHDRIEHASEPGAEDRTAMLDAVEHTLIALDEFRFVTVPELLDSGRPVREPWFVPTDRDWDA